MVFPVVMYGCESWTVKKAECQRIDAFEVWCWRRLSRVPWTQWKRASSRGEAGTSGFLSVSDSDRSRAMAVAWGQGWFCFLLSSDPSVRTPVPPWRGSTLPQWSEGSPLPATPGRGHFPPPGLQIRRKRAWAKLGLATLGGGGACFQQRPGKSKSLQHSNLS